MNDNLLYYKYCEKCGHPRSNEAAVCEYCSPVPVRVKRVSVGNWTTVIFIIYVLSSVAVHAVISEAYKHFWKVELPAIHPAAGIKPAVISEAYPLITNGNGAWYHCTNNGLQCLPATDVNRRPVAKQNSDLPPDETSASYVSGGTFSGSCDGASSATPNFNFCLDNQQLTLTKDVLWASTTGLAVGKKYTITICQDSVGGHKFAPPVTWRGRIPEVKDTPFGCIYLMMESFDGVHLDYIAGKWD